MTTNLTELLATSIAIELQQILLSYYFINFLKFWQWCKWKGTNIMLLIFAYKYMVFATKLQQYLKIN